MKRTHRLLLLTLTALAVRCVVADWNGLSGDEANGVAIATTGGWGDLIRYLREDGNPPLFYVLTKLYCGVFGSSDFVLRTAAILVSAALVPVVALLASEEAAWFLALCPPVVRYGDLVRMYGLLPLLSFLSTYFLFRDCGGLRHASPLVSCVPYVLATTAMLYCHHWGFFVLAAQILVLGIQRRRMASPPTVLLWPMLSLVLYLPWVPNLVYSLSHNESPWAVLPSLSHFFIEGPAEVFIGKLSLKLGLNEIAILYSTLLFALCVIFPPKKMELQVRSITAVGVAGYFVACVIASFKAAWRDRYLVALTPMLSILFVKKFGDVVQAGTPALREAPALRSLLPILLWLPFWIPEYVWLTSFPESSAAVIAQHVNRGADSSRDLCVISWEDVAPAVCRVLNKDISTSSFPDIERVSIVKWENIDERLRDDRRMITLFDRMEKTLQAGGKIWLIDSSHNTGAVGPPGQVDLKNFDYQQVEQIRMDQVRSWLERHAKPQGNFLLGPSRDMPMFLSTWEQKL